MFFDYPLTSGDQRLGIRGRGQLRHACNSASYRRIRRELQGNSERILRPISARPMKCLNPSPYLRPRIKARFLELGYRDIPCGVMPDGNLRDLRVEMQP